jgi:hypothetical protein
MLTVVHDERSIVHKRWIVMFDNNVIDMLCETTENESINAVNLHRIKFAVWNTAIKMLSVSTNLPCYYFLFQGGHYLCNYLINIFDIFFCISKKYLLIDKSVN